MMTLTQYLFTLQQLVEEMQACICLINTIVSHPVFLIHFLLITNLEVLEQKYLLKYIFA